MTMKTLFAIALLALTFTTGFTCSKNPPETTKTEPATQESAQPSQEQMAQPPVEGAAEQPAGAGGAPTESETK